MQDITSFRTDAPVTQEQYRFLDEQVKISARQVFVGRRLIPTYGPLGFGKDSISYDSLTEVSDAHVNLAWRVDFSEDIVNLARTTVPVPVLHKAFRINRRSLAASRSSGAPIDANTAKSAAYKVALLEDSLIIDGYSADGTNYDIDGLYQSAGNAESTALDFGTSGYGIDKINKAMALMLDDNIFPPYNVVLHPTQYMELHNELTGTATLEIDVIRRLIKGEIFVSSTLTAATGLLLSAGDRGFFDLAIGVDLTTEVETLDLRQGRDLYGLVYECVVPRIWETNAICTLTAI